MKILTKFIEVEFLGGTDLNLAVKQAKYLADLREMAVKFEFNSVEIIINPFTSKSEVEIVDLYYTELQRVRRVEV